MSCAKTAEPMEMLFGIWTWVDSGKQVGVHIGTTGQVRLSRLCAAAMQPFFRLLLPHFCWSLKQLFLNGETLT